MPLVVLSARKLGIGALCIQSVFTLASCSFFRGDAEDPDFQKHWEHPEHATAWHTQTLVAQFPDAALTDIKRCQTEVTELAALAANENELLSAMNQMLALVQKDLQIYHYCFYALARQMDAEIEAPNLPFQARSRAFFLDMKKLWLMARALVKVRGDQEYFDYLRDRYVEISNRVFGRQIEVIGTPLDERMILKDGEHRKPAAEVE